MTWVKITKLFFCVSSTLLLCFLIVFPVLLPTMEDRFQNCLLSLFLLFWFCLGGKEGIKKLMFWVIFISCSLHNGNYTSSIVPSTFHVLFREL